MIYFGKSAWHFEILSTQHVSREILPILKMNRYIILIFFFMAVFEVVFPDPITQSYYEKFLKDNVNPLTNKLNYHFNNTITIFKMIEDRLEQEKISQERNLNSLKKIATTLAERSEKNVTLCKMGTNRTLTAIHAEARNEVLACFNRFLNDLRLIMNEMNKTRNEILEKMKGINNLCIDAKKTPYESDTCISNECSSFNQSVLRFQDFLNENERSINNIPTLALHCSENILKEFDVTLDSIEICGLHFTKTQGHL